MTTATEFAQHPGQLSQAVATARQMGQDPDKAVFPAIGVVGTLGDSICYYGVKSKVEATQAALVRRVITEDRPFRLLDSFLTGGISDGQRNGTPEMRYSLIGRETTHDTMSLHLNGSDVAAVIAVVACDKPPVGTVAAILERNVPAVVVSDGPIRPGVDPATGEPIDIVSCFQASGDPDLEKRARFALNACPGYGSCGGMFTYNTMQVFIAVAGLEPLHMVSPAAEDERRLQLFPDQAVDILLSAAERGLRPRDVVTPASLRNAMIVALAMGGSTNVVLHAAEIARAAGIDFWSDVLTPKQFNETSRRVPVLVNARPFGRYSMVDIDRVGGLPVIVRELLDARLIDGTCLTCTGETLAEQTRRLGAPGPDGDVTHAVATPFKPTGGLRALSGNLSPEEVAVIKMAGVEGGFADGRFTGNARVFDSEQALITALEDTPEQFAEHDMVVLRYEGPRGAPGMPELLEPTSRITALCHRRGITIALMTDARFSGGSVGAVIGHVSPEAAVGGPIALIENGDSIVVDLNTDELHCVQLSDPDVLAGRRERWARAAEENGGVHPLVRPVSERLLRRARRDMSRPREGAGWGA
jgi:dihydroxy-acid dehydratase